MKKCNYSFLLPYFYWSTLLYSRIAITAIYYLNTNGHQFDIKSKGVVTCKWPAASKNFISYFKRRHTFLMCLKKSSNSALFVNLNLFVLVMKFNFWLMNLWIIITNTMMKMTRIKKIMMIMLLLAHLIPASEAIASGFLRPLAIPDYEG